MRLNTDDLIAFCKALYRNTDGRFSLEPTKRMYGYWSLELVNNNTQERELLQGGMTIREAYEYVRAFYRGLEKAKTIN